MASSLGLPRFVFFKSSDKYVSQTNQYVAGSLRCSEEGVTSPAIKFEMEMAETDDGDGVSLFNIRSCHNNKYWMAESPDSLYMTAAANKPNEDSSQWSCTLFEAVPVEPDAGSNNLIIRLRFFRNQKSVTVVAGDPDHVHGLYPEDDDGGDSSKFDVIDAESLVILPKTVVFKASNGKYLQSVPSPNDKYLQSVYSPNDKYLQSVNSPGIIIACATDIGGLNIATCTTYKYPDQYVRLTLKDSNLVLITSAYDFVMTLPEEIINHFGGDMFKLIKVAGPKFEDGKVVSSTTIAIRSKENNQFVRYDSGQEDKVLANAPSIIQEAVFAVEEPVMSRSIYNVKFRLADSRIYDESIVTLVSQDASNSSSETDVQHLKLNYVKSSSSTFNRSVSLSVGVATSFKTGIPFIAEGEIDISVEATGFMGWSDTTEESQEIESSQDVNVPPMTVVTLSVVATRGKCDVPFSYTQSDMLYDGTEVITEMDDGIYTGVYSWNFHYETTQKPLDL